MRVVLDTNVLASAAATRGMCADVLREVLAEHDLVISTQITDELQRVLRRKFGVARSLVKEFIWLLRQDTITVRPRTTPAVDLKDQDDLGIPAAAIAAEADVLITGDRELQTLVRIEDTEILSPRAFWERLTAQAVHGAVTRST